MFVLDLLIYLNWALQEMTLITLSGWANSSIELAIKSGLDGCIIKIKP